jgi:hypothetical protein
LINKKRSETEKEIENLANNEKELDKNVEDELPDESGNNNNNAGKNAKFNKNIGDESSTDSEMDDDRNDVKLGEDDDEEEGIIEMTKKNKESLNESNIDNYVASENGTSVEIKTKNVDNIQAESVCENKSDGDNDD